MEIYGTSGIDGEWTLPTPAPFSLGIEANQPTWSRTGDTLFYVDSDALFRVARTDGEWSSPSQVSLPLPTSHSLGWDFSMTEVGSLYVVLWNGGEPGIFRSALVDGSYEVPEPVAVGGSISLAGLAPVVAPDESYLIFASNRQGGYGMHDLWISFRSVDGSWSEPINMGPSINSAGEDGGATLTPDGENLFFTSQRAGDSGYNPYWVSAELIDSLRAQAGF